VGQGTYPADPSTLALCLFNQWLGSHYARSTAQSDTESAGGVLTGRITIGRRWELDVTVLNTLAADATLEFEAARSSVEQRLDDEGRSVAVWAPRGAPLPVGEPAIGAFMAALNAARRLEDGRLELRRPVKLHLRRTSTTGSVITILGGMAAHWAQFTNRVPGSYQLNSSALYRLPASDEDRSALAERIVLAAQQPTADESQVVAAEDAWSANDLGDGPSCVLGSPKPDSDEQSSALRRNLRSLLREAREAEAAPGRQSPIRGLAVLGAATYAEEEKLSWALRGMDPSLYAGYEIIAVIADGVVKPLLEPPRQKLPWDAPLV
jgi:hypothetical protein